MSTAAVAGISLPGFLADVCSLATYRKWLERKARTHVTRDRKRGNTAAKVSSYKTAIHEAVLRSGGRDAYTGGPLDWNLISRYDNTASKRGQGAYKKKFGHLPTVDHVAQGRRETRFVICAWRVNDAKNDLTLNEFLDLCRDVLDFAGKRRQVDATIQSESEKP